MFCQNNPSKSLLFDKHSDGTIKSRVGIISFEFTGLLGILGILYKSIEFAKNKIERLSEYFNLRHYLDTVSVNRNLKDCFDKYIIGQESAKSKIASCLSGYLDSLNDKTNRGSCCITLLGSSCTGKSLFVNSIS